MAGRQATKAVRGLKDKDTGPLEKLVHTSLCQRCMAKVHMQERHDQSGRFTHFQGSCCKITYIVRPTFGVAEVHVPKVKGGSLQQSLKGEDFLEGFQP